MLLFYLFLLLFFTVALEDSFEKQKYDSSFRALTGKTNSYLVNTEIYSDYLYCARSRSADGSFEYEKCNSYPDVGFLPLCAYMYSPSDKTRSGRTKYGCVYAHNVPQKCVKEQACFVQSIDLQFRDEKLVGAAYICSDNYCNQLEEPLFQVTRMKKKSFLGTDNALQVIISALVAVTTIIPFIEGRLQKRHWTRMRAVETPVTIDDKRTGSVFPRVQEMFDVHQQPMKFASLKKMRRVAKEVLLIYRHGGTLTRTSDSGSSSGHTPTLNTDGTDSSNVRHAPLRETRFNTPIELTIHPICHVFQKSLDHPKKVMRSIPTKFEYLAQKLIEHGPYQYNFDAVELAEMFDSVVPILAAEPTVLDLPEDTYIYGNIEGSYGDLFRWFHKNGWPPNTRVLFLGGLTSDSSPFSLETMALIFAMKRLMPQNVYIIRGAAETVPVKLDHRFPLRITRALQNVMMRTCGHLPLAATIGSVFFSHGGFPQNTEELRQIRLIRRPMFTIPEKSIANKLIFSQAGPYEIGTPGSRGTWLSANTMHDVLVPGNGQTFSLFVRARNCCRHGYMFIGEQILTLWSAVGACRSNKAGASLYIDREMNAHLSKMTQGLFTRKELKKREAEKKRQDLEKKKKRIEEKKKKAREAKKQRNEERRQQKEHAKKLHKKKKTQRKRGTPKSKISTSAGTTSAATKSTKTEDTPGQ